MVAEVAAPASSPVSMEALALYAKRLGDARAAEALAKTAANAAGFKSYAAAVHCVDREGEALLPVESREAPAIASEPAELDDIDAPASTPAAADPASGAKFASVDGETVRLCDHCALPLGATMYAGEGGVGTLVHGECMAQQMAERLRDVEAKRRREANKVKRERREEFDIGWKPEVIPLNAPAAKKLGCAVEPQAMACLVAEEGGEIRVAATLEPESAVNLEYLSIALQVRRTENREPLFSLDPVFEGEKPGEKPESFSMQVKRFEPEWLAGTSVGEVMFQADYHLKELSMGEFEQPVLGMKSCLEYSEQEHNDTEWSAREWFVVRKAEMRVSEDNVLVPCLRMGVEAREQVFGDRGLEDAAITRPDHPLVKYAEAFTHNFDLIAERKSVVSQLREVAKASILAKYLLESGSPLAECWFAADALSASPPVCCLEVPQLWNDSTMSKISVKDGALQNDKNHRSKGIYGGVDFGIDRFRLSAPSRVATSVVAGRAVLGRPATSLMATSRSGLGLSVAPPGAGIRASPGGFGLGAGGAMMGPARQFARLSAPLSASMSMAATRAGLGVPRVAAGLSMGSPQGVDLNLDGFNLSEAAGSWPGALQCEDPTLNAGGSSFLDALSAASAAASNDSGALLAQEERSLLSEVFLPGLSDRAAEADRFAPPPTSAAYLQRLRNLVKSESLVRRQREELFLSKDFDESRPGPLFPMSWATSFVVDKIVSTEGALRRGGRLERLGDAALERARAALGAAPAPAAVFDRSAEDGTRFRIYRSGHLEIRTVQEPSGDESVRAVFSSSPASTASPSSKAMVAAVSDDEAIVKVSEHVEHGKDGALRCFVVLETDAGNVVVTEKLASGATLWSENPEDLDARLALARTLRAWEVAQTKPPAEGAAAPAPRRLGALRAYQAEESASRGAAAKFAQGAFCRAAGERYRTSGFRRSADTIKSFGLLSASCYPRRPLSGPNAASKALAA